VSFTNSSQIEQFIESIFPSQQPPVDKKSPASVEEAERKRQEDYEAKWDLIYIIGAVAGTVLFITFIMVCTKKTCYV
jgi:farnesyl-diphosphate farnesyltransferase